MLMIGFSCIRFLPGVELIRVGEEEDECEISY